MVVLLALLNNALYDEQLFYTDEARINNVSIAVPQRSAAAIPGSDQKMFT